MSRQSKRPLSNMFNQAVGAQKDEEIARLKAEISQLQSGQRDASSQPGFVQMPIKNIVPLRLPENLKQPRRYFAPEKLAKLRDSIQKHGRVLEPILVRQADDGLHEIISGERRWRCCVELHLESIAAMVVEMSDEVALEAALIAHLLSEDISAIEETDSIISLLKLRLGQSFDEVKQFLIAVKNYQSRGDNPELIETNGDKVAIVEAILEEFDLKVGSFVSNRLPLLNLEDSILDAVRSGQISPTSATLINRAPKEFHAELISFSQTATKTQLKDRINQLKREAESPSNSSATSADNSRIISVDDPVQDRVYGRIRSIRKKKRLIKDPRVQEHLAQVDAALEEIEVIAQSLGIPLT